MKDEKPVDERFVGTEVAVDKSKFGSLSPLTAAQVVALLIKSDITLGSGGSSGACACGGACY